MSSITDLGNGSGFVYITDSSSNIITYVDNNSTVVRQIMTDALISGALSFTPSSSNERKYYLNSAALAPEGDITGAIEISETIISLGSTAPIPVDTQIIATDAITITRASSFQIVLVDTEGAAATDALKTISTTGFADNDIIEIVGVNSGRVTTLNETGNILLANSTAFPTGDARHKIQLQYSVALTKWVELTRTPGFDYTTAAFRAAGIPQPAWGVANVAMPVSGTLTLTPGTDKLYQVITGSPVMAAGYNITGGGSPIDGDTFHIIYNATPTAGVNVTTIFGKALTATQTAGGKISARAVYDAGTTAYVVTLNYDTFGKDLVDTVALALKQDDLGVPAANGYVLYRDTTGDPFWGPTVSNDTGWIDLAGFAWLPVGTRPQYRIINKTMSFRGTLVVPLNNAGAILPYASESDYIASLTVAPNTAATGGVTTDASGFLTFNQNGASITEATHLPDTTYYSGLVFGTRRVKAQATANIIVYSGVFNILITSAGKILLDCLNDPENADAGGVTGSSLFRLVTSNVLTGDYTLDFRTIDTAETIQGKTAATALSVIVSNPGVEKHGITMNAADPTQIGGFQIDISRLKAYLT